MIEAKHVHLIGAGGIGISAVGKWFLAQGKVVSGSDVKQSAITDDLARRGAAITIGHDAKNLAEDCDLVVYTEAAGDDNPERAAATARGVRHLSHFGFIAELAQGKRLICITGTHGKSTTTAMVGKIFEAAGLDPTVFVGSLVPGWELGNLRIGKSDILIVEGDEYKRKVLALHPETTVITNIELDHTDVYRDLADMEAMFHQLVEQTSGAVIMSTALFAQDVACGHRRVTLYDEALVKDGVHWKGVTLRSRTITQGLQSLDITERSLLRKKTIGTLTLCVPGVFNMQNALAALAVARAYGIDFSVVQRTLSAFTGIWRRFERVGDIAITTSSPHHLIPVISDYAHHPTAVKATLAAAKEFFPDRRIVLAFQPHQHNRTRELFDDFRTAFGDADVLVLLEIYGVEGRTDNASISSRDLLSALNHRHATYAADLDECASQLRAELRAGDVAIIMGAGDIDAVARMLVA